MMIKYSLLLMLLMITDISYGQPKIHLKGTVLNAETGEPISYATIGIPGRNAGTISDASGVFDFHFPENFRNDTLYFSAIGYHSEQLPISSIFNSEPVEINLQPKTYELNSFTVTGSKLKTKWIGKKTKPILSASYGISIPKDEIGAAYAFKIHWEGKLPYKLLHARMLLNENPNETLRMRCRVAAVDSASNLPGEDLIHESVITTFEEENGWVTCNMIDDQFYLDKRDFYMIFELLPDENPTKTPLFALSFNFKSEVYDRFQVMGKWRKNPNNMIYSIKIEY